MAQLPPMRGKDVAIQLQDVNDPSVPLAVVQGGDDQKNGFVWLDTPLARPSSSYTVREAFYFIIFGDGGEEGGGEVIFFFFFFLRSGFHGVSEVIFGGGGRERGERGGGIFFFFYRWVFS